MSEEKSVDTDCVFEYLKDEFTEDVQRDASREQLNSYRTSMVS